jgi:hypothetical protein
MRRRQGVRGLSSIVLVLGCTGFEAHDYDVPGPARGGGGVAGYSYQAGRGGAGSPATPPAPGDQEGDWGPPEGAAGAEGGAVIGRDDDDVAPPATHGDRPDGGASNGEAGAGGVSDDGGVGGEREPGTDGGAGRGALAGAAGHGGAAAAGRAGASSGGSGAMAGGRPGAGGAATSGAAGTATGGAAGIATASVFFSEYVEGSKKYKALELRASAPSSLDGCRIATYFNGETGAKASALVALSGMLGTDTPLVVCSPDLAALLGPICTMSANLTFNGNDAVALECGGTPLDVIGQIGADPGEAWTSGDASTANATLRRRCAVARGDSTGGDTFDPGVEWLGLPLDEFAGLGQPDCG